MLRGCVQPLFRNSQQRDSGGTGNVACAHYISMIDMTTRTEKDRQMNGSKLTEPISCRLSEGDFFYVKKVSNDEGLPFREVLRDLVGEAVQARLNPPPEFDAGVIMRTLEQLIEQNRLVNERCEELVKRCEQISEREAKLRNGLVAQMREFAGILGETLAAAIGARRLAWIYGACEALKASNYSDTQIKERWEAENKTSNAERDETIKEVKVIIKKQWPTPE